MVNINGIAKNLMDPTYWC